MKPEPLLARILVNVAALLGAGWFVDWVYQFRASWATSYTVVIIVAVLGGLALAMWSGRRRPNQPPSYPQPSYAPPGYQQPYPQQQPYPRPGSHDWPGQSTGG